MPYGKTAPSGYGNATVSGITGARFNMTATLLHQNDPYDPIPGDINLDDYGYWTDSQDPLTGDIVRVWVPYEPDERPVDPNTPGGVRVLGEIPCLARGIVDGGIRVAGTTERFGDTYENIDYVKMWVPSSVYISKRDRVTNIRTPDGRIKWLDEEFFDPRETGSPVATVFNVNGVTPLFDVFNYHTENFVLLERAAVQGDESE